MLKSSNRLKRDTDFAAVLRGGKRSNCGDFTVAVLDNSLPDTRVGVVVSKKVGQLSTKRNRLRRIVLSEFAKLIQSGQLKGGKDIVIRFTKQPADLENSSALRSDLNQCLAKLSLV